MGVGRWALGVEEGEKPGDAGRPSRLPSLPLLMLVTEPGPPLAVIERVRLAVEGGANLVQLRDRDGSAAAVMVVAAGLKRQQGAPVVVNGCAWIARDCQLAGAHLPDGTGEISVARECVGPSGLVGRSVHSVESARRAEQEGADYLVAGTIYASSSHPGQEPAGIGFLEEVCRAVRIPVLAIGGITPERIPECIHAGAKGVAVLSPIMHSANPRAAAQEYRRALKAAWYREVVCHDSVDS